MLPKLAEQVALAKEYGFVEVTVPLEEAIQALQMAQDKTFAESYLPSQKEFKLTTPQL